MIYLEINPPNTLKRKKVTVSIHYLNSSCTHEFDIWICHRNAQVRIEFGLRSMTFGFNFKRIFQFRSLSPQQLNTINSNLIYGFIAGIRRSSPNLVMV
jgi:hypothetical protein